MSVIVTVQGTGDPARFEQYAGEHPDVIERIMGIAKSHGLIAHRWYGAEGGFMAVDEWPDGESFFAFFEEAGPEIGPVMEGVGATGEPKVTVWRKLEIGDEFGWGA